jgi:hypothetical protein
MIKSGSTFAFQIAKELSNQHLNNISGKLYTVQDIYPQASNPFFLNYQYDVSEFAMKAYDMVGRQKDKILIAKIHQRCLPQVQEMIDGGDVYSVSTFRHPEEIALSLIDSSFRDLKNGRKRFEYFNIEATIKQIEFNIQNYNTWKALKNNLNILFDELILDPYKVATKMKNHFAFQVATNPIIDFFLENKEGRIGEFNKGIVDRHKIDFPRNMSPIFAEHFSEFIDYVDELKKQT